MTFARKPRLRWVQVQHLGPQPTSDPALAYDSARRRVILFGGSGGGRVGTWEWDGDDWTQVADVGPSPRFGHAMVYDAHRRRVVLFGGHVGAPTYWANDTWEWDGESWTQVADTGPSPRYSHGMAYDASRKRSVLFGGRHDMTHITLFGDTWAWDGAGWMQQADEGPSPRFDHAMAYDVGRQRVMLFGGYVKGTGAAAVDTLGDTWEWNGSMWVRSRSFGPPPAARAALVSSRTGVLLFGGTAGAGADVVTYRSTWEWCNGLWTEREDMGPSPRIDLGMAYDSGRKRVVLFGGSTITGDMLGDTWELFEQPRGSSRIKASARTEKRM